MSRRRSHRRRRRCEGADARSSATYQTASSGPRATDSRDRARTLGGRPPGVVAPCSRRHRAPRPRARDRTRCQQAEVSIRMHRVISIFLADFSGYPVHLMRTRVYAPSGGWLARRVIHTTSARRAHYGSVLPYHLCPAYTMRLRERQAPRRTAADKIFYSLKYARIVMERWCRHCTKKRPHSALRYQPPAPVTLGKVQTLEPILAML